MKFLLISPCPQFGEMVMPSLKVWNWTDAVKTTHPMVLLESITSDQTLVLPPARKPKLKTALFMDALGSVLSSNKSPMFI